MVVYQRARWLLVSVPVLTIFLLALSRPSAGQSQGSSGASRVQGSVPTGQATATPLDLSLQDAFQRALNYNLGAIEGSQDTRAAHATRLRSLNALLPNLSARVGGTVQQLDLAAEGLGGLKIPGVHLPGVVGPFGVEDARAYLSQEIFSWSDIKSWKSSAEAEKRSIPPGPR
jgi:hypothetical protein